MERNENGEGEYCIALNQSTMDHVNATTGLQMDTIQLPENLYIWGTMNPNDSYNVFPAILLNPCANCVTTDLRFN